MAVLAASLTIITAFLLLSCPFASSETPNLKRFSREYGPFNDTDHYRKIFAVESPATITNNALQVTPDTVNGMVFNLQNRSGRVMLRKPFKLWDGQTVGSFNASFLMNIFRPPNATAGEGIAFVIAPDLSLPGNSHGQYLGLTNSTTDGKSSNQLVAVEFDTFKQDFDPDANHVGLNINSVKSNKTESLFSHGIEIAPEGAILYNVWILYNGSNKVIEVYMVEGSQNGPTPPIPATPVLRSELDLAGLINQKSYFGFAASTGNFTELNCVLRWNLTVDHFPGKKCPALTIALGVCVPVVVLVLLGAAVLGYYLHKKRMLAKRSNSNILGALSCLPGMPREFQFTELKKATNNFDDRSKLGQGGYGVVYKGVIARENLEVAVKCFSRESIKGEDDFLAELTIINRLRHRHLVRLLAQGLSYEYVPNGSLDDLHLFPCADHEPLNFCVLERWCHKNGKLLLVYEYMPNGSLDKHLFAGADHEPLSWMLRYKIISGVASALHYLHNEYDQRVVHRDLKASNIMLDCNFNARLGDFGLARALDNEKTSYAEAEGVLGTIGYIAPECFHTGKATQQSDIYAFGAVLMEMVCGRKPGSKIGVYQVLVDWVWSLYREGRVLDAVDERLGEDFVAEEAERILLLGLACSHPIANERPESQAILQIISGSVPVPHVPPFKPAFVWPSMMPMGDITDTTSITTSLGSGWSPQYLSRESYVASYSDHLV
ncbi:hypothetical protein RJ639_034309 [Escallonia herrerae]|uniref:non-specific serine/threonine protein kinase n=1 Tax=Escallonia herrerae TaxID=1293975 RepID=A0AA89B8S0_9ASTE|nr:hypothetical protein RJ639_034309 [Escallonia herrerae]